jgi:hypothetical protein
MPIAIAAFRIVLMKGLLSETGVSGLMIENRCGASGGAVDRER